MSCGLYPVHDSRQVPGRSSPELVRESPVLIRTEQPLSIALPTRRTQRTASVTTIIAHARHWRRYSSSLMSHFSYPIISIYSRRTEGEGLFEWKFTPPIPMKIHRSMWRQFWLYLHFSAVFHWDAPRVPSNPMSAPSYVFVISDNILVL